MDSQLDLFFLIQTLTLKTRIGNLNKRNDPPRYPNIDFVTLEGELKNISYGYKK